MVSAVDRALAWEGLSIVVDGVVVRSAVVAGFSEGILAYWPPGLEDRVLNIFNKFYIQVPGHAYLVLYSLRLGRKFLIVLTGERVLALEIDKRLNAEKMGEKLLDSLRKLERLFSIDES
ncbi:hypothetical protein Tagg_0758 [Thermosphaera aggregans DSM 11486]|uniref:Roadblock/LAMTOR2 domain-containing protein n=1 Tax=Thermosphaera aggregans (strain DSM 11486 / M11TL) TaxID=633148 RepID=D5U1N1_THEAM|nr:hypothetical protein Tagg_0758 [Thermosphaera aggregans DSM 11486]